MSASPSIPTQQGPAKTAHDEAGYSYIAFISYRHAPRDRRLAKWLHGQIEQYRTPRELVKRGIRDRVGRVFRDEEELAASASLSDEIEAALLRSRFLIVVCSRSTPESRWVNEEIERFRSLGRGDHILALLVDGEPAEAFPPALLGKGGAGGGKRNGEVIEPLAADLRPSEDESERSVRRTAKLRIIATLLGCKFDDLRQREQDRQRRRWTVGAVGLFALLVLVSSLAVLAWVQRGIAVEQRQIAVARQLVTQSELLLQQQGSLTERGTLLAAEGMKRLHALGVESLEADQALRRALKLVPPLVTTLAQTSSVAAIAYVADGRLAVLGSDGGTTVWDTGTDLAVAQSPSHGDVQRAVLSGSGTRAALAVTGEAVQLSTVGATKAVFLRSEAHVPAHMALSQDGSRLATGDGQRLQTWDTTTGEPLAQVRNAMPIMALALREDGHWVAAAGATPELEVIAVDTGQPLVRLVHAGMESVEQLSFGPPNTGLLATVSLSRQDMFNRVYRVSLWDVVTSSVRRQVDYDRIVDEAVLGPLGRHVAVRVGDDTVRLLAVAPGNPDLELRHDAPVLTMAFGPREQILSTADRTGTVTVWDTTTGKELARIGHPGPVSAIAVSPDGRWLATASGDQVNVHATVAGDAWASVRRRRSVRSIDYSVRTHALAIGSGDVGADGETYLWFPVDDSGVARRWSFNRSVEVVRFSPDGRWLFQGAHDPESCDAEGSVTDMRALVEHASLQTHALTGEIPGCLSQAAFSPDGQRIVASGYNDSTVRVYESASGKLVGSLSHRGVVTALAVSPNGRLVAAAVAGGRIQLWEDGKKAAEIDHGADVQVLAFGTDGRGLASGGQDGLTRIWEIPSGRETGSVRHQGRVIAAAFSPVGGLLASAGSDGRIFLWSTSELRVLADMVHASPVEAMAFAPDGRHLASGGEDGTVRVWAVPGGVEVARVRHGAGVSTLRFTPDGRQLMSGDYGGLVQVSLWRPAALLAEACLRVGANLSQGEWRRLMLDEPYERTCPNLPLLQAGGSGAWAEPSWLAAVDRDIEDHLPALQTRLAVRSGRLAQAVAALDRARALDPEFDLPAMRLNGLCWLGGQTRRAALVVALCDRAVGLAPDNGTVRDSRGLVRAQTSDIAGAIDDFRFYVTWAKGRRSQEQIQLREAWIQALQDGHDPFDDQTLNALR